MCYSRSCPHENYWGECTLADPRTCPYGPKEEPANEEEEERDDGEPDGA